ncbi:flagellar protein FliT [Rhodoferax saidenbachensis]|nr:flagellar protein FliT [Rhodoferax saidenbachensis]
MPKTLIECYRAIEASSVQMLDAARSQDWDTVVHHEGVCAVLIEQLRSQARRLELDAQERAEKSRIMLRILCNDAKVRDLTEPWLAYCDARFNTQSTLLH